MEQSNLFDPPPDIPERYAGHTTESAIAVLRQCSYQVDLRRRRECQIAVKPPEGTDWDWWPITEVMAFAWYLAHHPPKRG